MPSKGGQADLNRRPPDPQSGAAGFQPTKTKRVARRRSAGCTTCCTSEPPKRRKRVADAAAAGAVGIPTEVKPEPVETDFAAAFKMLAMLPLTNEERAEAVRRLMAERANG